MNTEPTSTIPTGTCGQCGRIRPLRELLAVRELVGRHRSAFVCRPALDVPGWRSVSCFRDFVPSREQAAISLAVMP